MKNAFSSAFDSFKEGWNKINSLFSIVLVLFFFASCGSYDKGNNTTGEDLKEEVSDVVDVSKDYTVEQWNKMNAEIDEKMLKVSNEYNELNDEVKDKFKSKKAELDNQKEQLQDKIKELNQAADEKKDDLKQEVNQLKTALDESLIIFQKEMADETNQK